MDMNQGSMASPGHDKARQEIADQVEAFLAQGGEIQELSSSGQSDYAAAPAWAPLPAFILTET